MMLTCYELQSPLSIGEGAVSTLVLENPIFYRNFICDMLLSSCNASERFVLWDKNTTYDFSKNADVITDIYNISFDSRQITNKVNQLVFEEYNLSCDNSEKLIGELNGIAGSLVTKLDFSAVYSPIADMSAILKLFGFSFDDSGLSFLERITEYMGFMSRYLNKKLFVLLNLKSALSQDEYYEFAKSVGYKMLNVLLVENHSREIVASNETVRIIDNDLCEF